MTLDTLPVRIGNIKARRIVLSRFVLLPSVFLAIYKSLGLTAVIASLIARACLPDFLLTTTTDFCPRFVRPPPILCMSFSTQPRSWLSQSSSGRSAVAIVPSPVPYGRTYPVRFSSRAVRFVPFGRSCIPIDGLTGRLLFARGSFCFVRAVRPFR